MTCKCGSDRIGRVHAKHSDMVSFQAQHLDLHADGKVPYANYLNGDRFLGGDYLNLVFCLDCGQIQNFERISDEDLDEQFGDE